MTVYRQGDVVLIPFPFTDFSTFKQRPAVVISSNGFNRIHQDVIVVAITSSKACWYTLRFSKSAFHINIFLNRSLR
jgi:mRNA-degrading endonuclease toxin of MazEF toxin-antitoxin module